MERKGLQNPMNGEGPRSDRPDPVEIDDNVVRLTDWLGPREELVPFGPGADAGSSPQSPGAAVPTADDFWSESSAAVQDALTAPRPDLGEHRPGGRSTRPGRASAAAIWNCRRALLRPPRPPVTDRGRTRPSVQPGVLAMLAAAGLLALAIVLFAGDSPSATSGGRVTAAATGQPVTTPSHAGSVNRASLTLARLNPGRRSPSAARDRVSARHRVRDQRAPRHRAPTIVPTAQPVAYTTPATSAASYAGPAASGAGSSSSAASSAPTAATSSTPARSSTHQPALGASGTLAPGSSPDG